MKITFALTLGASALLISGCSTFDKTTEIKCQGLPDAVIATNTGEFILEQRLLKYQELEEYGRNMTGSRGGQRAICTIKNDPLGYKWVSCGKDGTNYTNNNKKLFEVEEAVANSDQYRGWSGACKVKL